METCIFALLLERDVPFALFFLIVCLNFEGTTARVRSENA
jgi:hypothetical protein